MEIHGTRSRMTIEFDHRSVTLTGELTLDATFYADLRSLKNWDPPYDAVVITDDEKRAIVEGAVTEAAKTGTRIVWE